MQYTWLNSKCLCWFIIQSVFAMDLSHKKVALLLSVWKTQIKKNPEH